MDTLIIHAMEPLISLDGNISFPERVAHTRARVEILMEVVFGRGEEHCNHHQEYHGEQKPNQSCEAITKHSEVRRYVRNNICIITRLSTHYVVSFIFSTHLFLLCLCSNVFRTLTRLSFCSSNHKKKKTCFISPMKQNLSFSKTF